MTTVDQLRHSPLVRLANVAGGAAAMIGRPVGPPDADEMIATAERRTGLSTPGDDAFEKVFRCAVQSVNESPLTSVGRWGARSVCLRMLENRLRIADTLKRNPQIADQAIERPVMVVGWYRSGTTLLHRLLSSAAGTRVPHAWELYFPVGEVAARKANMRGMLRLANLTIPALQRMHRIEADSPEEATVLLDNEALGVYFLHAFGAHRLGHALGEADLGHAYDSMKRQLQMLSWSGGTGRWILKCPFSMWKLNHLFEVFPDVQVVHIHRDIRESAASICSLAAVLQHSFLERVDHRQIGQFWSDFYHQGWVRSREVQASLRQGRVIDVQYSDLVGDRAGTLRYLAERLELDLPIERLVADDKAPAPHRYDLAQFGIDGDALAARFADPSSPR